MEISTSTWMMVAFIAGSALSIWKMYPFLVNRTLEDDDTGEDSYNHLVEHMKKVLQEIEETPSYK
jgi:membrane protein implicated in regulation of membrane protease activity